MIIYKYIPCLEDRLRSLKNNQIWMSLPEGFNDPFDCDHSIQTDMTHEESLRVIAKIGERNTDELSPHPDLTKRIIEKDGADYFKKKLRQIGVYCFSSCW